jgi:hypothetical protein
LLGGFMPLYQALLALSSVFLIKLDKRFTIVYQARKPDFVALASNLSARVCITLYACLE